MDLDENSTWYKIGPKNMLDLKRITTVQAGHKTICLSRTEKGYGAICNKCPHQGGPLGDGYIENGFIMCPWHAYEFDPIDGKPPGGYDDGVDSFEVEEREDGIYVKVPDIVHQQTLMDQVVELMVEWGVTTVFGIVGHSNLGLADALRNAEKNKKLNYIGVRHEGAAAFAASGYAKLTNKPAACFSIAGPGATNLLTGLWDAKVDRVPILALTGQVNTQVLGPGAFQELPLEKVFEAVSNWSQTILKSENATELMALAIKHAIVNRDVAHLIFPDEVQTFITAEKSNRILKDKRISSDKIQPNIEIIEKAVAMIDDSSKPAIIIGNGARKYSDKLIKLAEILDAPLITTFKAKGTVPDSHPLACGVLGRSGTPVSSASMVRSDLLLVFGASFSNHTSINQKRTTIQVDFDRLTLGKFHNVDLPIWSEIGLALDQFISKVKTKEDPSRRDYISRKWKQWREDKEKRANISNDKNTITNAKIMDVLSNLIPEDAVIAVDVGNNAYSLGMYFESKNQHFLMSGYLGSIGFAFPAAMGAWMAEGTNRKVVAIAGDGGFGQYMAEFTTAVKYNMNITLILLNNNELGKITREQKSGNFHVWQTSLVNPNFAEYANNCGGLGIRVKNEKELTDAIEKALVFKGPSLVEIISSSDQL
ncbi:MAG: putative thiamine pyrophosphate-containing protein YdaP [Candidatus Heimdallarchaeota archaeon LC_2]|nr:MAG: putative thiamine pyrophosphate-containing protein YdaP [Candidatus Heimdallarchaeota archaeon LC_2]